MAENELKGTVEEEINAISMGKPHLVILGAGASIAATDKGDKHGSILPSMDNFIKVLNLENEIPGFPSEKEIPNFEVFYSKLADEGINQDLISGINNCVSAYFSGLELPSEPNIYDYLILGLREKDMIATFNWDPFLLQALRRNSNKLSKPNIVFLHGNVSVGICYDCRKGGTFGAICPNCNKPFKRSKLLFPVKQKNYTQDVFIRNEWTKVKNALESAFMVTIFGYNAPKTDAEAIKLFKNAWGSKYKRNLEQIEIIDIKSDDECYETWRDFIHSHHYEWHDSFFDSWIANHPRRSGEAPRF